MPNWKKLIVSGSSAELTTLKLTGLSAGTPTTALMLDGSNNVEKRTLGSNAFNSTAFTTNTGTVTSVEVTVGTGLDVSGSPITTAGTIDIDLDLTEITLGAGLDSTATGLSLDLSELTDMTADVDTSVDELILLDNGAERRKRFSEIFGSNAYTSTTIPTNNNQLTNGAQYVTAAATLTTAAQPNITSLGTLTSLTVDDITINGSTISDSGDLTLDIGGDLNIDVDGADIVLKDGGTAFGRFKRDTSDFVIKSETQDKDILFKGNDGGSTITALQLDMSDAGKAHFYGDVVISGSGADKLRVEGSGSTIFEVQGSQGQLFSVTDDLTGTIFNVSDISGVPILSVEGDGTVDVDGDLQATALGVGTAAPSTTGAIRATNDITAFYSSDKRLKNNITNIEDPLDKLKKINGVSFEWIPKEGIHDHIGKDYGVIAQEIEEVLPELVTTRDNGYKAVKYEKIVALLIETNKQLLSRIEELENKVK